MSSVVFFSKSESPAQPAEAGGVQSQPQVCFQKLGASGTVRVKMQLKGRFVISKRRARPHAHEQFALQVRESHSWGS